MSGPVVSVVIATYRAGDYLRQAIESALAQSFTDLEIIVSDDANDPEVNRLAGSFRDPRIRYRSNPSRLGPARNHWAGFAAAQGRYISILNHDDIWRTNFLTTLAAVLDRDKHASLAFCNHDIIDSYGHILADETERVTRIWGRDRLSRGRHCPFADLVVSQTIPLAMGGMFRRGKIDFGEFPDVGPAYDLWLAYELSRYGAAAWFVPEHLTAWRVHPTQLTGQSDLNWASGSVDCWRAMESERLFHPYRATIREKFSRSANAAAKILLMNNDRRSARTYARLAIGGRLWNWRAWVIYGFSLLPPVLFRVHRTQ